MSGFCAVVFIEERNLCFDVKSEGFCCVSLFINHFQMQAKMNEDKKRFIFTDYLILQKILRRNKKFFKTGFFNIQQDDDFFLLGYFALFHINFRMGKEKKRKICCVQCVYYKNSLNGEFEDRASVKIVNRLLPTPKFTQSISQNQLTLTTSALQVKYIIGEPLGPQSLRISGYNVSGQSFQYVPSGDPFDWSRNLFGTIRSLDEINNPIPLNCSELEGFTVHGESLHCTWAVFGRNGYALINDTNTTMIENNWIPTDNWWNNDMQDWYFFGHGLDFKKALHDFSLISGSIPLVPRYALGSMHCRWYDYGDWNLREAIRNYEDRNLPLDVAIIDMDWHVYGPWGAYTWNYHLFSNPNITQNWFKQKRLRTAGVLTVYLFIYFLICLFDFTCFDK
ncbi:hypothetical protein RFI_11517 [Reticulomyxa filosa]|uniref:Glycoside hydrolase family 31 TIM barrel domain-containing protein n=1 Tax=Reticulomyxa filosa TaxID=46433 RepID=X6NI84_RETFI|nr:hypothetical protein RFI_11517 [Reticulomyxa filosa]|eukprot:ETO25623.1 hypothetical protein RFI_11517 [Reticulomyxa filosa]